MNRQARAFGISLLLHAGALLVVVTLSGAAAPAGSPRVIDLRILQPSGSAVAPLPERTPLPPRPPPRKKNRQAAAAAPPAQPQPRVTPPSEEPPLPAVPAPVAAAPVAPPPLPPDPVEVPDPAAAPAAVNEASQLEAAPVTSAAAPAVGDREWPEAQTGGKPSVVASAASDAVAAPGAETGFAAPSERVAQSSGVPEGDGQGQPPRDFSALREIVQRHLVYPSVARRRGWEGKVTLSFIVGGDGRVREIAVLESSGRGLLDRHAVETVKQISCFPAAVAEARIIIPVVYRLD